MRNLGIYSFLCLWYARNAVTVFLLSILLYKCLVVSYEHRKIMRKQWLIEMFPDIPNLIKLKVIISPDSLCCPVFTYSVFHPSSGRSITSIMHVQTHHLNSSKSSPEQWTPHPSDSYRASSYTKKLCSQLLLPVNHRVVHYPEYELLFKMRFADVIRHSGEDISCGLLIISPKI